MKTLIRISLSLFIIIALHACKSSIPVVEFDEIINMDTITIDANSKRQFYRASEKRENDLLHTKLEVSFNWDSAFLYGRANLHLRPYFYPTKTLVLDAKGFKINEVALVDKIGKRSDLQFSYDNEFLRIELNQTYTRKDTYQIYIDYVSMPNKLKAGGSAAITSDKGLYFINNDGSDPNKPKQIWTQGETEASSCWFPTIDSPNEKTSQEIYITVDSNYVTLSNGELIFQTENPDGTRTDYWKQNLSHAPYLFMMAVGEFAVVEDEWRDIPVNYYVEPKYKDFAKDIYPNTPEMLEFFSNKLGYDYPWDKYHQVIVRDYVSGAMENTGAVIFGDFIQGDDRFLIDNSGEDIVAHEMFHHWFGDLVTCESWSNLPLNESFATYGEYLWNEFKYGKDQADYHGYSDLKVYLTRSRINKKDMIRFHYEDEMEMFDSHSYQKGGRILHMLRQYVGDDAFFESLQLYLKTNEFQTVEIHNLRLAFEKVTGEDLNWFFNQWFLSAGHPIIEVTKEYNELNDTLTITIEQTQDGEGVAEVFELPTNILIMQANGILREKTIRLTNRKEVHQFKLDNAPLYVFFDSERTILGEVEFNITKEEAISRYGGHFLTKYESLKKIKTSKDLKALDLIEKAMKDDFWFIRKTAVDYSKNLSQERKESTLITLKNLAEKDEKSNVRSAAFAALSKYFNEDVSIEFFEKGIKNPSYSVVSTSLDAIYTKDKNRGLEIAKSLENVDNPTILLMIANIYAEDAKPENIAFYETTSKKLSGFKLYPLLTSYGQFLENQDDKTVNKALPYLTETAAGKDSWFIRMAAINSIAKLKNNNKNKVEQLEEKLKEETDAEKVKEINQEISVARAMKTKLVDILMELEKKETNSNLKRLIKGELN